MHIRQKLYILALYITVKLKIDFNYFQLNIHVNLENYMLSTSVNFSLDKDDSQKSDKY